MLVLSRKPGEEIVIGGSIKLTIISIKPGRVKVGIEAPPDVDIRRAELPAEPKPGSPPVRPKATRRPGRKTK